MRFSAQVLFRNLNQNHVLDMLSLGTRTGISLLLSMLSLGTEIGPKKTLISPTFLKTVLNRLRFDDIIKAMPHGTEEDQYKQ